jgi:hypothetical protein
MTALALYLLMLLPTTPNNVQAFLVCCPGKHHAATQAAALQNSDDICRHIKQGGSQALLECVCYSWLPNRDLTSDSECQIGPAVPYWFQ